MQSWKEFVKKEYSGHKYIAYVDIENNPLAKQYNGKEEVLLLIGPEGDFTPEEVAFATEHGYTQVNLGQQRLRTETAGLYAISLIRAMMDKA